MRTIVCDLTRAALEELGIDFDEAVCLEELRAAHGCQGCFGCWVRTPGACVIRDALGDLPALLARSDELWVFSENSFGWVSADVKRALDRCIPFVRPEFRIVDGRMHHRLRHDRAPELSVWLWGPSTEAERACARRLADANALNLGMRSAGVRFVTGPLGCGTEGDSPAADAPAPSAPEVPALPRRIALVNGSPRGPRSATAHLLADLSEALGVYARLAGVAEPELVEVACRQAGAGASGLAGCDTVVLGYPLYVDALPSGLVGLLGDAARLLAPGARVYALANLGFYEAEQILPSFSLVEGFCAAAGAHWAGGVAVGAGGMVLPVATTPRMGMLRRSASEAIDRMIAAILSGTDAGAILARPAVPRWAYRLAAEAQWRRLARESGADLGATP